MTREEKLIKLCEIRDEIKLMLAENSANYAEIERTGVYLILAFNQRNRLADEIKLDDLVHFCNTGSYPE